MTTLQLIDPTITPLQLQDSVAGALQLMHALKLAYLPVVSPEDKFLGIISEDYLQGAENKSAAIVNLKKEFILAAVGDNQHFMHAASISTLYQTNMIPVVNETGEFLGAIRGFDLINALGNFCGANEYGAILVFEIELNSLAISEINSIVESDGATILHMNISPILPSQLLEVTLQINKREISTIIASFERYDYHISFYSGEELFENNLSTNYQNLMNYLDI